MPSGQKRAMLQTLRNDRKVIDVSTSPLKIYCRGSGGVQVRFILIWSFVSSGCEATELLDGEMVRTGCGVQVEVVL